MSAVVVAILRRVPWWAYVIAALLAGAAHAAQPAPRGALGEACALIDFAATDALLAADWYTIAAQFLHRRCGNKAGALAAAEKACDILTEAADPDAARVCRRAAALAKEAGK